MKTLILSFVATFSLLEFSAGQTYYLNQITLAGGTSSTGRLNAELTSNTGGVTVNANVPVCGSVDLITATFLCQNLGYIASTGYGTVTDLNVPSTSSPLFISNLQCADISTLSQCTFTPTVTCDVSTEAAVSCCEFSTDHLYCMCSTTVLTPGQVAGISIGIFLFCLILICIPVIICCCCCCGICACATGASRGYDKM